MVLVFFAAVVAAVFVVPAVSVAAVAGSVVEKDNTKAMTRAKNTLGAAFTAFTVSLLFLLERADSIYDPFTINPHYVNNYTGIQCDSDMRK